MYVYLYVYISTYNKYLYIYIHHTWIVSVGNGHSAISKADGRRKVAGLVLWADGVPSATMTDPRAFEVPWN